MRHPAVLPKPRSLGRQFIGYVDCLFHNRTPNVLRTKWSLYLSLVFVTSVLMLPLVFTTLAEYDDEGYVMLTIQSFLGGGALYDQTHTQYGPAFYVWSSLVHSTIHWPLTQDAIRLKTVLVMAIVTCLIAATVWRVSGSRWAASSIAILSVLHLDKLALEPGHPQELALVISVLALWLSTLQGRFIWLLIGGCTAAVAMTKVNCGAVLVVPLWFAITERLSNRASGQRPWRFRLLRWSGRAGLLCLPVVILLSSLSEPGGWLLPSIAILGCGVVLYHQRQLDFRISNASRHRCDPSCSTHTRSPGKAIHHYLIGGAAVTAAAIAFALVNGTTPHGLVWGLVGQHRQFTSTFFHAIEIRWPGLLVVAVLAVVSLRTHAMNQHARLIAAGFLLLIVATVIAKDASSALEHGLQDRGAARLLIAASPVLALWLVSGRRRLKQTRLALAGCCLLWPLMAFPTPGTQTAIGSLPVLIALGIFLGDLVHWFHLMKWKTRPIRSLASIVVALAAVASLFPSIQRWNGGTSLNFVGSRWLRLPQQQAREQRDIVNAIRMTGASELAFDAHTHGRFYFWTQTSPLTDANPTFWPRMLTESESERWTERLDHSRSPICIVVPPDADRLAGQQEQALRRNLHRNSQQVSTINDWRILVRAPNETVSTQWIHSAATDQMRPSVE